MTNLHTMLACYLAELGLPTKLTAHEVLTGDYKLSMENVAFLTAWIEEKDKQLELIELLTGA